MKKIIYFIAGKIWKIKGRISGYLFARRFYKICIAFGWGKDDISDFLTAVMYQIKNRHYCVPAFCGEEEDE